VEVVRTAEVCTGQLAATRTGLPPAGEDELTNSKIRCYVTASPPILLAAQGSTLNQAIAAYNENSASNENSTSSYYLCSAERIGNFFDGLTLVSPGVVSVSPVPGRRRGHHRRDCRERHHLRRRLQVVTQQILTHGLHPASFGPVPRTAPRHDADKSD
jgi:hypothetical protein